MTSATPVQILNLQKGHHHIFQVIIVRLDTIIPASTTRRPSFFGSMSSGMGKLRGDRGYLTDPLA